MKNAILVLSGLCMGVVMGVFGGGSFTGHPPSNVHVLEPLQAPIYAPPAPVVVTGDKDPSSAGTNTGAGSAVP